MKGYRIVLLLAFGLALLLLAPRSLAEVETYSLPWWTVDSGGGVSSGGSFTLTGSIGQADAGGMSGEQFGLSGGFWPGLPVPPPPPPPPQYRLFLPLAVKQ